MMKSWVGPSAEQLGGELFGMTQALNVMGLRAMGVIYDHTVKAILWTLDFFHHVWPTTQVKSPLKSICALFSLHVIAKERRTKWDGVLGRSPNLNFGANHQKKMDSAPSKTPHPLSFPTQPTS